MSGPETSSRGAEYIELNKPKTKESLKQLKELVDAKADAAETMNLLVNTALQELTTELNEANIPAEQHQAYLDEYQTNVDKALEQIKVDKVIESSEAQALETFMTNINNFPKLKAFNDSLGAVAIKDKYGDTIAKFDEMLATVAGLFGWNIGEPHIRAKLYEGLGWVAKKVGINLSGEPKEAHPDHPDNFNNKSIFELARLTNQNTADGKSAKDFIMNKLPAAEFGTLKAVSETRLTFVRDNEEIHYELGRDMIGEPIVKLGDKEAKFDEKITSLAQAIRQIKIK